MKTLEKILEKPGSIDSQIDFCELMAFKTLTHDHDLSRMYLEIKETLKRVKIRQEQQDEEQKRFEAKFAKDMKKREDFLKNLEE